jgi:hypothetical protein
MKTAQVVILAAAILGAAWILKPVPVEQVSQRTLQQREEAQEWFTRTVETENAKRCAASIGKTIETLDRSDPNQEGPYRKCMWPELEQSWLRRTWNRMISALIW